MNGLAGKYVRLRFGNGDVAWSSLLLGDENHLFVEIAKTFTRARVSRDTIWPDRVLRRTEAKGDGEIVG
jgi:hypothetical protein